MAEPKTAIIDGKPRHYSAGVIVVNDDGQLLLIDRATPPFGLAAIAGHIDEGETPEVALVREVAEETGLKTINPVLLHEEFVDWNWCGRGITGHYWYVYKAEVSGTPEIAVREIKSIQWYDPKQLKGAAFESVWEHWLKQLGYL